MSIALRQIRCMVSRRVRTLVEGLVMSHHSQQRPRQLQAGSGSSADQKESAGSPLTDAISAPVGVPRQGRLIELEPCGPSGAQPKW